MAIAKPKNSCSKKIFAPAQNFDLISLKELDKSITLLPLPGIFYLISIAISSWQLRKIIFFVFFRGAYSNKNLLKSKKRCFPII
ncbi:hypothetical protein [Nitrosomonas sp. Nm33]|uniref:hypothetical protein n=1 Tax=Nitrosomonas sp. Nm33 TaxID=133724 RepID=UPI002109092F|nr:hypothetical protein [Nitrosomonas sp. Nm33]